MAKIFKFFRFNRDEKGKGDIINIWSQYKKYITTEFIRYGREEWLMIKGEEALFTQELEEIISLHSNDNKYEPCMLRYETPPLREAIKRSVQRREREFRRRQLKIKFNECYQLKREEKREERRKRIVESFDDL